MISRSDSKKAKEIADRVSGPLCVFSPVKVIVVAALIAVVPVWATTFVVDNTDTTFAIQSGLWTSSTAPGHWLTDYVHCSTNDSLAAVQWQLEIETSGQYEVSAWIPATAHARPSNARYTVEHSGGTIEVTLNQASCEVQWVSLGVFTFDAGSVACITLSNDAEADTQVVADAIRLSTGPQARPEFRAFWASTSHQGFESTETIDDMVSRAMQGHYNVINALIMYKQDAAGNLHGALWNSNILPKAPAYPSEVDPLAHLIERAHANGLEVHGRLIPYIVSQNWPPVGNSILTDNPHWLCCSSGYLGEGPTQIMGWYYLDPGSPDVQEYLIRIVRELVTHYEIDGIHWDFIRHLSTDSGYPTDNTYEHSSLARFRAMTGRSDIPPPNGDQDWNDFRRRTVDELVLRSRAEIAAMKTNPAQPISLTAAVAGWGAANPDFTETSAYKSVFQNWEKWMRLGWMDGACPMIYLREHEPSQQSLQRAWVDLSIGWRYQRHMYIGQCLYRNTMENSIAQMEYAFDQGAEGTINFAYGATADNNMDDIPEVDWSWYPFVNENLFTEPAPVPELQWRTPAATEGTLWGQVADADTGTPVENAIVTVSGQDPVLTDGNGYYVVTLIPASASGTDYPVTAQHPGYLETSTSTTVTAGDIAQMDITFPTVLAPVIADVDPGPEVILVGKTFDRQLVLVQGTANPWTLVAGPDRATISVRGYVSGWTASQDEVGQVIEFIARAENSAGSDQVSWQVLVEEPPPCEEIMLTDFEGYSTGQKVLFQYPGYSGSTKTHLEDEPNAAAVTDELMPFSGSLCNTIQWQFVDSSPSRWMRLTTCNAPNIPNPTIALDRPIRLRMRLDSGRFRLSLGIRETGTDADYGEDGGTSGTIEWVGASESIDGAPQGVLIEAMPGVWQTIVFDPLTDPILGMTGDGVLSTLENKGTLEHLAFTAVDSAGPFTVYIDDVEMLCADSLPPPQVIICESRDSDGILMTPPTYDEIGNWSNSTVKSYASGLSGTGSRFITYELPNAGTDNATFVPMVDVEGKYEVFVTWADGANCYDAQYTIRHHLGETIQLRDQISTGATEPANSNQWVSLGKYWFSSGQSLEKGSINVSEQTVNGRPSEGWGSRVYTDALKLSLVEAWPDGDYTGEGDVNLEDYLYFHTCMTGPRSTYIYPQCQAFDLDMDNDIDLNDFSGFQVNFNQAVP